jgi:hypothetical protein
LVSTEPAAGHRDGVARTVEVRKGREERPDLPDEETRQIVERVVAEAIEELRDTRPRICPQGGRT